MKKLNKYYDKYKLTQVYKTGEKNMGCVSRRGRKPIGWAVYKVKEDGMPYFGFMFNWSNQYMPLVKIDGELCGECFV